LLFAPDATVVGSIIGADNNSNSWKHNRKALMNDDGTESIIVIIY